tara:strand:- start:1207 stop:1503 length:297 start_codon:yes stop_codon:yes gene_type:complete
MNQKYNIQLLHAYLAELQDKYKSLSSNSFSLKARIRVKQEIEMIRALISDYEMGSTWEKLSAVFNSEEPRPNSRPVTLEDDDGIDDISAQALDSAFNL